MSTRSNLPMGYVANEKDSLNKVIHELREIKRTLTSSSSGDATAANQALEIAQLTAINTNTTFS